MNIIPEAAKWKGEPSPERIAFIQSHYFHDSDNAYGMGYGALFFKFPRKGFQKVQPPLHPLSLSK